MAEFWAEWGALAYVAAAIWAFFEGETFVLVASAAGAATGIVDPWILMIAVWIGSYAGDQTWFTLGRKLGPAALRRWPKAEPQVARANMLLEKYGTLFVLTFRFLYGVRNFASAAMGIAGMCPKRFAFLNFFAAGIWAGTFVTAGWFLGALLGPDRLLYGLGGIAATVIAVVILRRTVFRRRAPAGAA
ncbi:DedA family protein [Falsiroseomonas sp. HW251]|uniref:DedA family protein n=1 Tax=Falsiroseomonas sp. HW251 TaxID=3390998 RepID=UPI003D322C0D